MSESSSKSSQPLASKQEKDGTEKRGRGRPRKQPPVSPGTASVKGSGSPRSLKCWGVGGRVTESLGSAPSQRSRGIKRPAWHCGHPGELGQSGCGDHLLHGGDLRFLSQRGISPHVRGSCW
uniref:High mobility group protein HMG-I/HMG-Y n=1 Tax=Monodon monoceros TaxID=40151 RepID=A0A8C6BHG7_MONMO